MGCTACASGGCGTKPNGCKGNGGCSTGGCNRLNVFDWLNNIEIPTSFEEFDIVEIRFKGGRKDFYRNEHGLDLTTGDAVVVEAPTGYHVGHVSLKGELVRLQMLKKKVDNNGEIRLIYRIANEKDLEKYMSVRDLEATTMYRSREIIQELKLRMKLSDVEFQADRSKATFYYSADDRVDFRDLIKKLAEEFKVRIEMRQISLRHEAGRLGGIGSCGRELCCSTWLTDFKSVSTTAARYQNLSLNPSKLSGQCGRLKCCLNYELETYMEALRDIPNVTRPLQLQRGDALLQKTDIFRRVMWFGFRDDNNWYPVPVERVQEILEMNAQGVKPELLVEVDPDEEEKAHDMVNHLEVSLERMDEKFKSQNKKKKKRKKKPAAAAQAEASAPAGEQRQQRPARNRPRPEGGGRPQQDGSRTERARPEGKQASQPRQDESKGEGNKQGGNHFKKNKRHNRPRNSRPRPDQNPNA